LVCNGYIFVSNEFKELIIMELWINETSTIGVLLNYAMTTISGDIALALFMIFIFFVAIGFMFKIPLEYLSLLMTPFTLGLMAYDSSFVPLGGVVLIIIVVVLVKAWFTR